MIQLFPFNSFTGNDFVVYLPQSSNSVDSEGSSQENQVDRGGYLLHTPFKGNWDGGSARPGGGHGTIELRTAGCRSRDLLQFYDGPSWGGAFLICRGPIRGVIYFPHVVSVAKDMGLIQAAIITVPLTVVDWLNNWPIGLKLNTELSEFCSQTFMVIISSWNCRQPSHRL